MRLLSIAIALCFSSNLFAGEEHAHPPVKVSPQFENMKALVGTWKGTTKMGGKEETMKVTYELTSGGTAIIEKLMAGTPHEMITVYANRGDKVHATHFCALGNQPEMELKSAKENQFVFEMNGTRGITSKKEMYMRGVTLALNGNKLKHEWTNYKDNKKGELTVFELTKN
jgi:hypothetical protein